MSIIKIILAGPVKSGKTSLRIRFESTRFSRNYRASLGADRSKKNLTIDNENQTVEIWELSGREDIINPSVVKFYKETDAVIITIDLTSPNPAKIAQAQIALIKKIYKQEKHQPLIVFAGTKAEIEDTRDNQAQLERFSNEHQYKLFITSSAANINVSELFNEVAKICATQNKIYNVAVTITYKQFYEIVTPYLGGYSLKKSAQSRALAKFIQQLIGVKEGVVTEQDNFQLYNILKPYIHACAGKTFHGLILGLYHSLEQVVKDGNEKYREENGEIIRNNLMGVLRFIALDHQDRWSFNKSGTSVALANDIVIKNEAGLLLSFEACVKRASQHYLKGNVIFLREEVAFCFKKK